MVLFILQCEMHIILQMQPLLRCLLHIGEIKTESVPSRLFGFIHRRIGLFQNFGDIFVIAGKQRNTNTGCDIELMPLYLVRLTQGFQHLLSHDIGLSAHLFTLRLKLRQQQNKLVTTQTGGRIFLAQAFSQAIGNLLQQRITDRMTQGIVDRLEIIQIEKKQRTNTIVAFTFCNGDSKPFF